MELCIVKKLKGKNYIDRLEYDITLNQMISETLPFLLPYVKKRECSYDITSSGVSVYFYDDYDIDRADFCDLQECLQFLERSLYNFLPQLGMELDTTQKFSAIDFPDKMFDKFNCVKNENTDFVSVRI